MTGQNIASIEELQQKAQAGDAQAQFELACEYSNNVSSANSIDLALNWLGKAAENDHPDAQFALGLLGFLPADDSDFRICVETFFVLRDGSIEQQIEAVQKFGVELEKIKNANSDIPILSRGAQQNCKNINSIQQIERQLVDEWLNHYFGNNQDGEMTSIDLAFKIYLGLVSNIYQENAFIWLQKAASQEHKEAAYWLAKCYYEGIGTPKNPEAALSNFKIAAEHQLGKAQYALVHNYLRTEFEIQNNISISEDKMMMRLAKAYAIGECVEQNQSLELKCLETVAHISEDNLLRGDACYQAAILYFVGKGIEKDYINAMKHLIEAVKCNHVEANEWLENTYLNFVFPYFSEREDIEQCYKFAYEWLAQRITENSTDYEVNFGLGVLCAFGKGAEKNQQKAIEYFNACMDECSILYPQNEDFTSIIYEFCEFFKDIYENNSNCLYLENLALFFLEKMDIEYDSDKSYIILPLLTFDFHIQNNEFEYLKNLLKIFEGSLSSIYYPSTKINFIRMGLTATRQAEVLEQKNKALEEEIKQKEALFKALHEKEKEMLSFFTHTMRNALATAPESLRQAIHLLGGDVYEQDTKHYQAINKIAALFSTLSLTDCLIDTFKQSISDPQEFKLSWRLDHSGDATPRWVIALALKQALNRIIFMSDTAELRKLLNSQETALIKATRKSFIEDVLPLNVDHQGVDTFYAWTHNHVPTIEVITSNTDKLSFGVNQIRFSLLFAITSELILNALKYWDGENHIHISWVFNEQNNYVFSVKNHCKANAASNLAGTHKGLAFIKRLVELLGEHAQFICKTEDQLFSAELILNKALFDEES